MSEAIVAPRQTRLGALPAVLAVSGGTGGGVRCQSEWIKLDKKLDTRENLPKWMKMDTIMDIRERKYGN
jgi:hypothetical protein